MNTKVKVKESKCCFCSYYSISLAFIAPPIMTSVMIIPTRILPHVIDLFCDTIVWDDDDEDTHHLSLSLYGSLTARNIIIFLHGNVSCTFHRLSESIVHSPVRPCARSERAREHGLYVSTYRSFIAFARIFRVHVVSYAVV